MSQKSIMKHSFIIQHLFLGFLLVTANACLRTFILPKVSVVVEVNMTLKKWNIFPLIGVRLSPLGTAATVWTIIPGQLRWVVGLLTGHCHLKGHLFKLGLTDGPTCERCLQEDESATHILCDCGAIAYLRFLHLGQFFTEPSDFYAAPLIKVLHFIRNVGLIKG
jgi:hypothetical protein